MILSQFSTWVTMARLGNTRSAAVLPIHEHHPDAVISDLSHFSFGAEVTNRAAFEILEWCAKSGEVTKVIVTCVDITDERRQEAARQCRE